MTLALTKECGGNDEKNFLSNVRVHCHGVVVTVDATDEKARG
jgi:hypothetical protein